MVKQGRCYSLKVRFKSQQHLGLPVLTEKLLPTTKHKKMQTSQQKSRKVNGPLEPNQQSTNQATLRNIHKFNHLVEKLKSPFSQYRTLLFDLSQQSEWFKRKETEQMQTHELRIHSKTTHVAKWTSAKSFSIKIFSMKR
jgi:hypothetical protein